jgi:hypothetical protein
MIWNRTSKNDEQGEQNDSLDVVFHPKGGFSKQGSFTDGNKANEYERQEFLTLEVACKKFSFVRSWGLETDYDNEDELTEANAERFGGQGVIKRSQHGRYSLSFLGSRQAHTTIDISIHKSKRKHISIVPFKASDDMDNAWDEHFCLQVRLDETSFAELRDELRANPDFSVLISVKLDSMRGLYTTWSPSISEGRVLKFLDDKKDVSNHSAMPEDFQSVGFGGDRLPFSIAVGQFEQEEFEE